MEIPTIRLLDNSNLDSLIEDLRLACTKFGFFYLEDHGVPLDLIERVRQQCKELFYLPLEEKQQLSDKTMTRGYTAFEEETLDPNRQVKGDTKEGYYLGEDIPIDSPRYNPAKLMGPNQWPDPERCPSMQNCQEFQNVMNEYRMECKRVGFRLVQLLALAIGLKDEHYFDDAFTEPLVTLRLLRYARERSDPSKGIFACGAHSDYGMITLLWTDETSGLQIFIPNNENRDDDTNHNETTAGQDSHGSWIDVPARPTAYVVNLGDMLERWTNGLFRSTLHRVITDGSAERFSLPCFYDPHFDTEVDVLDICCSVDNPPKYPRTTSGQHLLDMYKETHADFEP
jgi:isopenicillin N synthase-like dioxygenase